MEKITHLIDMDENVFYHTPLGNEGNTLCGIKIIYDKNLHMFNVGFNTLETFFKYPYPTWPTCEKCTDDPRVQMHLLKTHGQL